MVGDAGRAAHGARAAPVVVVLHAAADVVRRRHVVAHVVEEPDRQVRHEHPRLRLVVRIREAAVVADEHVIGVRRIDPDRVMVRVDARGRLRVHRLAAVERLVQVDAAEVDDLGIVRIDPHLAEVHRPRVRVVHLPPGRAGVVRAVEAGGIVRIAARCCAAASAADRRRRHRGRHRAAPALRSARRGCWAAGDRRRARCGRADRRARRPSASSTSRHRRWTSRCRCRGRRRSCSTPSGGADTSTRTGPCCRSDRITRSFAPVSSSTFSTCFQVRAAVGRLVDAALAAGPPERAGGRDEDDVVVARIDHDAVDVARGRGAPCSSRSCRRRSTCRRRRPTTCSGGCSIRRCRPRRGRDSIARSSRRRSTSAPGPGTAPRTSCRCSWFSRRRRARCRRRRSPGSPRRRRGRRCGPTSRPGRSAGSAARRTAPLAPSGVSACCTRPVSDVPARVTASAAPETIKRRCFMKSPGRRIGSGLYPRASGDRRDRREERARPSSVCSRSPVTYSRRSAAPRSAAMARRSTRIRSPSSRTPGGSMPAIGKAALARPNSPPIVAIRRTRTGEAGNSGWRSISSRTVMDGSRLARGATRTENASPAYGWTRTSRTGPPGRIADATISLISRSDTGTVAGNPGAAEVAETGGLKLSEDVEKRLVGHKSSQSLKSKAKAVRGGVMHAAESALQFSCCRPSAARLARRAPAAPASARIRPAAAEARAGQLRDVLRPDAAAPTSTAPSPCCTRSGSARRRRRSPRSPRRIPSCGIAWWGVAMSRWGNPFAPARPVAALEAGARPRSRRRARPARRPTASADSSRRPRRSSRTSRRWTSARAR